MRLKNSFFLAHNTIIAPIGLKTKQKKVSLIKKKKMRLY